MFCWRVWLAENVSQRQAAFFDRSNNVLLDGLDEIFEVLRGLMQLTKVLAGIQSQVCWLYVLKYSKRFLWSRHPHMPCADSAETMHI